MATPVILYTSAGMPIGSRARVAFFRPTATSDGLTPANTLADTMAAGVLTNAAGLACVIEDLSLELAGNVVEREGIYGEDSDVALVRKRPKLNLTAQMASGGTVTLCPGDYCELIIGTKITSTKGTPVPMVTSRWFLDANSISQTQNAANKFSLKLNLDRENSGAITEF